MGDPLLSCCKSTCLHPRGGARGMLLDRNASGHSGGAGNSSSCWRGYVCGVKHVHYVMGQKPTVYSTDQPV